MKPTAFKKLIEDVGTLSASECIEAKKALRGREQKVQGSLVLREAEEAIKTCPYCDCEHFTKSGVRDGRQRFKCKAYGIIAKAKGIQSKSVPAKKAAGSYHIQNINSYHSRLKGWMHRFYGVATKNLDNYLGRHRMIDKDERMNGKTFMTASFR